MDLSIVNAVLGCVGRCASDRLTDADWHAPKLLCHAMNVRWTNDMIRQEYADAKRSQQPLRYQPCGPMNWCFGNVARTVGAHGGETVFGWQICPSTLGAIGVELEAHAVWRNQNGELVEVTEADPTWMFSPSGRISSGMNISLVSGLEHDLVRSFRCLRSTKPFITIVNSPRLVTNETIVAHRDQQEEAAT